MLYKDGITSTPNHCRDIIVWMISVNHGHSLTDIIIIIINRNIQETRCWQAKHDAGRK